MQSIVTVKFYSKPKPQPLFSFEELCAPEIKGFFWGLRLPMDPGFEMVRCRAEVNEWSLARMFNFDDQLHLIPTFLGNDAAWMFTWEFNVEVGKEPTSAWRGKYTVWYHGKPGRKKERRNDKDAGDDKGQEAFYLFKQSKKGNDAGEWMLHSDLHKPGPHEDSWFGKEMEKIKTVLEQAKVRGEWNPPFGEAGLSVTCVV